MKRCPQCDETDPAAFNKNKAKSDGLSVHCKSCVKRYSDVWYSKNSDRHNGMTRRRRVIDRDKVVAQEHESKRKNIEATLLAKSRERAKRKGWVFNIELSDIVVPEFCPGYPWIKLDRFAAKRADNLPSLDRIDSALGYIKGNVRVTSWAFNRDKRDLDEKRLEALLSDVRRTRQLKIAI